MSDLVLTAIITAAASIAVALITKFVGRAETRRLGRDMVEVKDKTEAVREQVQNSHSTNFRDDHDDFRSEVEDFRREVRSSLSSLGRRQDNAAKATVALRNQIAGLADRFAEHIDGPEGGTS